MNRPHFRRHPRPTDPEPEYSRLDRLDGLPGREAGEPWELTLLRAQDIALAEWLAAQGVTSAADLPTAEASDDVGTVCVRLVLADAIVIDTDKVTEVAERPGHYEAGRWTRNLEGWRSLRTFGEAIVSANAYLDAHPPTTPVDEAERLTGGGRYGMPIRYTLGLGPRPASWSDLFGIDPDFTGDATTDEYLATEHTRYDAQWPDVLAAEGGRALGRALDLADLPADQSGFTGWGEYEIEPEPVAVSFPAAVVELAAWMARIRVAAGNLPMNRAAATAYDLGLPVPLRSDPPIYREALAQHGAGVA